ncbi:MAG: N-acetylglucosamine-6-phosphate deacetylase [Clostridia bacterium]|nr:N-acetylglucosamine-6-phosphate deacetylase [Clostridia bacterium]
MKNQIINAKIVTPNVVIKNGVLVINDGIIESIGKTPLKSINTIDAEGKYLVAGFIDIHCHGGNGYDFMDATSTQMLEISKFHLSHGTTTLYATTMSDKMTSIESCLDTYKTLYDDDNLLTLNGVHLEGPWLSPSECGAQDTEKMGLPSQSELLRLIEKYPFIKRFSVAPELENGMEVGVLGKEKGLVMSVAHTDADFDTLIKAIDNGYSLATHLYSGMHGVYRKNAYRIAGAVEGALYDDRIFVEIIADGKHLPAGLLKLICKVKGYDRVCLITDAMRGSGFNDGVETVLGRLNGGVKVIIEDGVAKLPDRCSFAGSVATTERLFKTILKLTDVDVVGVSKMASLTPARVMGLTDRGSIEVGKRADICLLDDEFNVKQVFLKGKVV